MSEKAVEWTGDTVRRLVWWSDCVEGAITQREFVALCHLELGKRSEDQRLAAAIELTTGGTLHKDRPFRW